MSDNKKTESSYAADGLSRDAATGGSEPQRDAAPQASAARDAEDALQEPQIVFYAEVDQRPAGSESQGATADPAAREQTRLLLPARSSAGAEPPARLRLMPAEPPQAPPRSRARGCLFAAIAALVVLSLLGTSLFSLYWFWETRHQRAAEVEAALTRQQSSVAEAESPIRDEPDAAPVAASELVAPEERVNRIAFVNESRQIETISPDGSDRRLLTQDARAYQFPAWSPDGRSIAAIGSSLSGGGVYLVEDVADPPTPSALTFSANEPPFYLYWSPDGAKISFLANARSDTISLNIVDAGGEDSSRTIALGSPMYWHWTADGRRLLMHAGRADESQLVLIDDFGRPITPRIPQPGLFQAPGISASGRYWAYSQLQAGSTSWLVLDDRQSGEGQRQRHAGVVAFNWSPARDELAFVSGGQVNRLTFWGPLRLMDAETGEVRLLSSDIVLAFFWSPDGTKIATVSIPAVNEGFGEEFEVRHSPQARRLITYRPAALQTQPHTFQINVIDVASGEGRQLLEAQLSPLFLAQYVPFFDQYEHSHRIWSPDSNAFLLPVVTDGVSEVTIIDARNGRLTPLAQGSIGFWTRQ